MIYFYALVSIVFGAFLALKGLSNYRLFLSLAVTAVNALLFLSFAELQPDQLPLSVGIISSLVGGILTYLLYRLVTYVWTWYFFMFPQLFLMIIYAGDSSNGGLFLGLIFLDSIILTFLLRKQIKPILIGLMSGFSVGLGATTILVTSMISNASPDSDFMLMLKLPIIVLLAITISGVLFQYFFVLKKNPELAAV